MSGIFITTESPEIATVAVKRLSFTEKTQRWVGQIGLVSYAVTRVDASNLWSPAHDPKTGIRILLGGRVAFDEPDWKHAESLPYEGGLASRLLIDRWLKSPPTFARSLNGAFGVVVYDSREKALHIFTDRLGIFPIYKATNVPLALSSHPDVLANFLRDQKFACDFDATTLAEAISTGCAVQPFTYYQQIQQLEPASHYHWKLEPELLFARQTTYWQPAYLDGEKSFDDATMADALATAITNAVRRRTLSRFGKSAVLLSGGVDSRCALFGASDPGNIRCVTLCDEENEEVKTARRLATAAGAEHHVLKRSFDYYGENAAESMRIAGGMWNFIDAHFLGFREAIARDDCGSLVTGCYADYMLKGLGFNRSPRQMFGRVLPLYDLAPFDFQFYHPHEPLSPSWESKVKARLQERFPTNVRNSSESARLAAEDLRLRPFSREADACGRLTLQRCFPWEPFLADSEIIDVCGKLSPNQKLNGIIFGKAVGQVIGLEGRKIPNNNYGAPVNATEIERVGWFLWAVLKRKVRRFKSKKTASKIATTGSWPNWGYYIGHSEVLAKFYANPNAKENSLFIEILGFDPWQKSQVNWGKTNTLLFTRLYSAILWLRQQGFIA